MNISKEIKIPTQIAGGMFGGTILGIAGFLKFMDDGGNSRCFSFLNLGVDYLGYEACGLIGMVLGIFLGVILGITIVSNIKINNNLYLMLVAGSFVLPFLYGCVVFFMQVEIIFMSIPIILFFMACSVFLAALIVGLINWRKLLE